MCFAHSVPAGSGFLVVQVYLILNQEKRPLGSGGTLITSSGLPGWLTLRNDRWPEHGAARSGHRRERSD